MKKATLILAVILVVQIIIYTLVSTDKHHVTEKVKFLSVDTSQVDYLKIVNDKGELVMRRIGSNWKITEPFEWGANPSYITTLLEKMDDLYIESAITSNPDKHQTYELDDLAAKGAFFRLNIFGFHTIPGNNLARVKL